MVTGDQIVAEARTYLGTPYHHIGRLKGVGVDCIGLVTGVAQALGITYYDLLTYSRRPDGVTLMREFEKNLIKVTKEEGRAGDIGAFWFVGKAKLPCHAGIFTDHGLLHTYTNSGKVVEHVVNTFWAERTVQVFRFPGIVPSERKIQWPQ